MENIENKLIAAGKEFGIKIKPEQAETFQRYMKMLLEWNEKINLTAITEPDDILLKHFIDSLSLLKAFEIKPHAKIVDVGTGAGFPGLPLKIMRPDIEITLLDGSNKRLGFLNAVSKELNLEALTVHKRAEEAGRMHEMRESYDVAVSRAVARLNTLAEYCLPLVKMKGHFIAMKSAEIDEELLEAENSIAKLGGSIERRENLALPSGDRRSIVIIRKLNFTPKEYPRHGGTITKHPL